jgi:hypothetical protein
MIVVPAQAGTQRRYAQSHWIPAFAGMTLIVPAQAGTQRRYT